MHETGLLYDDEGLLPMSSSPPPARSAMFFSRKAKLFSSFMIALHYEKLIREARLSRHFMISGQ